MLALRPSAECDAHRMSGRRVQRVFARDTTDPIGAKQLPCHIIEESSPVKLERKSWEPAHRNEPADRECRQERETQSYRILRSCRSHPSALTRDPRLYLPAR